MNRCGAEIDALGALASGAVPHVAAVPDAARVIVEAAYGFGIGEAFLMAVPISALSLVAIIFLPNKPPLHQVRDRNPGRTG
jgi:hypothetical protein